MASKGKMQELDVDSILPLVGEFSRFQYVLEALLCIAIIPQTLQVLIMYFAAHNSPWRCTYNSTVCTFPQNMTFSSGDSLYEERCKLERKEWEFVYAKDYSIMTQVCNCFIVYSFQFLKFLAISVSANGEKSGSTIFPHSTKSPSYRLGFPRVHLP